MTTKSEQRGLCANRVSAVGASPTSAPAMPRRARRSRTTTMLLACVLFCIRDPEIRSEVVSLGVDVARVILAPALAPSAPGPPGGSGDADAQGDVDTTLPTE